MKELITIDKKFLTSFIDGDLDEILSQIREEVMSVVPPDLATDKGRKEVASLARKLSKSKVAIDNAGKELVSEWKQKAKLVDASRKKSREYLDCLRDEIRKPLTEYEEEKKKILKLAAEKLKLDTDHDEAISLNASFDKEKELEALKAEIRKKEEAEQQRLEKETEKERAIIAKEAEKERAIIAKEAGREAKAQRDQKLAADAKRNAELAAQKKIDSIEAENKRLEVEAAKNELERVAKIEQQKKRIANLEEIKRLADEEAKQKEREKYAEINRLEQVRINSIEEALIQERIQIELKAKKEEDRKKKLSEDIENKRRINNLILDALMDYGFDQKTGEDFIKFLVVYKADLITINYSKKEV